MNTKTIPTSSDRFTCELVHTHREDPIPLMEYGVIAIRSGEFRYVVQVERAHGGLKLDDMVKVYAYGDMYSLPSDIMFQLALDMDRLLDELDGEI